MSTSDPELPLDALRALGLDDAAPLDDAPMPDVPARIAAHLEASQGPWRAASPWRRALPFVVAGITSALLVLVVRPAPGAALGPIVATTLAALTGLIALVGVAIAPLRPRAGELAARAALLVGVAALVVEGALAAAMPAEGNLGIGCFLLTVAGGLVPLGLVVWTLRGSGFPLRRLHAVAAALAGLAVSGATVWLHCPAQMRWHLVVGHMGLPAVVVLAIALVVTAWLGKRALPPT